MFLPLGGFGNKFSKKEGEMRLMAECYTSPVSQVERDMSNEKPKIQDFLLIRRCLKTIA